MFAYIDPMAGSVVLQTVVAAVVAVLACCRRSIGRLLGRLVGRKSAGPADLLPFTPRDLSGTGSRAA